MTSMQIEAIAVAIEGSDDDNMAVTLVARCGDEAVIAAVREAEAGAGSGDSPRAVYPRVLRRIAGEMKEVL